MCVGSLPCYAQRSTNSVASILIEKLTHLEDSVKVGDMVVYNAFKYQYLSQQGSEVDTTLLIEKVFKPYPKLWNDCLSKIFGEDGKVYERQGFINYNRKIFNTKRSLIESKLTDLLSFNLDSLLSTHLKATRSVSGYAPKGKWIIFFGPDENLSLMIGGCSSEAMAIDLTHSKINRDFLTEAFPHELNHMVYEETHKNDVNDKTALGATIDEGLACYYTYQYFKGKMSKYSAVESMTKKEFAWYLQHEKEIFTKSKETAR